MNARQRSILVFILTGLVVWNAGFALVRGQSLPATAPEGASASYRLDWTAVGEASGGDSASAQYHLSATIGQVGAGTRSESAHYALCVGFQCASANAYRVYLPLVWK
jgi:hypothetical protein